MCAHKEPYREPYRGKAPRSVNSWYWGSPGGASSWWCNFFLHRVSLHRTSTCGPVPNIPLRLKPNHDHHHKPIISFPHAHSNNLSIYLHTQVHSSLSLFAFKLCGSALILSLTRFPTSVIHPHGKTDIIPHLLQSKAQNQLMPWW
ncbi:hypothetical protein K440DRAFT_74931 [Wilcoxina mikolae CBS 423.85]|nr:hypothetical protein K440DRAFT_74931 [Wilcoxina mikolae CBS 423.85]